MKLYKSLGMSELFYILNNDPEKKNLYTNGFNLTTDIENEEIVIKGFWYPRKHTVGLFITNWEYLREFIFWSTS